MRFAALMNDVRHRLGRPYRLKTSILLTATLVIVVLAVLNGVVAYERLGRETMASAKRWAESVADLVASNNTQGFILNDIAAIESNLQQVALLPGIVNLAVFRPDGRSLVEVLRTAQGLKSQVAGPTRMEESAMTENRLSGRVLDGVYEAWASVNFGAPKPAWVRVQFSLQQRSAELERLWYQSLMALLVLVALVLLSLNLIVSATLRPIRAISLFASKMPEEIGSQITLQSTSLEAEQLAQTLNQTSRRIAEELGRVQAIVNTAAEAIIGLDVQAQVVAANPAAYRIFAQPIDLGLQGQGLEVLIQDLDLKSVQALFAQASGSSEVPVRIVRKDFSGRRLDGSKFPVEVSLGEVADDDVLRYVCIVRDITKEVEVDRMKSEFIATAAHELRTPMVSILGFTELLLERNYAPERQNDMLQTIYRQSEILIKMVSDLLDLSRIESGQGLDLQIVSYPLAELIGDSVKAMMRKGNERQVEILQLVPVSVLVDPGKMQLALINLLGNAFKYSPQGGAVTISARLQEHETKHYAVIEVRDAGLGMTPEQLAQVFDRFYRADKSGNIPGTGLGLNMVKEIAERHSGKIELQSQIGIGTTALLWLPVSTDSPGR
ncbi:MAG: ATP-binding protein [Burkholderiaceae bacterium]